MKKTIVLCDVTKKEGPTIEVRFRGRTRKTKMDAAGDTDEWWEEDEVFYDFSHEGACKLLFKLWEKFREDTKYQDQLRVLEELVSR